MNYIQNDFKVKNAYKRYLYLKNYIFNNEKQKSILYLLKIYSS